MKKYITTLIFSIIFFNSFAQSVNSNVIIVRRDTTVLKSTECEWIIKSLTKNNTGLTAEKDNPLPALILQAIEKDKLKAIDRETNKPIPGKEIYTWHMAVDTIAVFDDAGNIKYNVNQRRHNPDNISRIRICQDWYFDKSTGKFQPVINWIELLEEIHTSSGFFVGHKPLCRIYY